MGRTTAFVLAFDIPPPLAELVFADLPLTGGTLFTEQVEQKHGKPMVLICERDGVEQGARLLSTFLKNHPISAMNVGGPRESEASGLGKFVRELLTEVFAKP